MHWLWLAFAGLIALMVVIDLGLVTRRPRAVSPVEGFASFALWVIAAAGFSLLVWYVYEQNLLNFETELVLHIESKAPDLGGQSAWLQFVTCYALELALSLDNLAVLTLLLRYFRVPAPVLGRTLFWNVLTTLTLRLVLVAACASLLREFEWFKWPLGGVLVIAMLRALLLPDETTDFDRRWYIRALRRTLPISDKFDGQRLITNQNGRLMFTPIVLIVTAAGFVDVLFASDSVPALFSVTRDPFIAFSAGAMALLSLRSLALAVSSLVGRFRYLRLSVVFVLLTVAGKMFLGDYKDDSTTLCLAAIGLIVAAGIGASALHERLTRRTLKDSETRPAPIEDLTDAADVAKRNFRKIIVLIAGTLIVLVFAPIVGLIPGPGGLIVAAAGLALLATEFIWARRLLTRIKNTTANMAKRTDSFSERTPPWLGPVVLAVYVALVIAAAWFAPYPVPAFVGFDDGRTISMQLVLTLSVGPLVIIGYWAYRSIRLWRRRQNGATGRE